MSNLWTVLEKLDDLSILLKAKKRIVMLRFEFSDMLSELQGKELISDEDSESDEIEFMKVMGELEETIQSLHRNRIDFVRSLENQIPELTE